MSISRPFALVLACALTATSSAAAASFRFDATDDDLGKAPAEAPLSLTASDGTGLELVRLEARAVIEGPLAFTELRLAFKNPEARVIEGRFRVTLPEGAALSRFAMKLDDRWQEGEVVEKEAAQRAYEDFLHRRQDPALLEQSAGNEFTARVFPIPAGGIKELIVSYSHALTADGGRYRLPLRGLPEIGKLDVRVAGQAKSALVHTGWVPDRDFVVDAKADRPRALRDGAFVVTEITPVSATTSEDRVKSLTILLDTSASRALGIHANGKLVEGLAAALARGEGANTTMRVAVFDQDVELVFDGKAGMYNHDVTRRILRRRALGASNFERALHWAAKNARTERLVIITDGVATAGADSVSALDSALTAVANSGVGRVDAIATGGLRDSDMLRAIVAGHARRDGAVIDGDASVRDVARRLTRATRSGLKIDIPGAQWVWPNVLDSVQAGDPVLLYVAFPKKHDVKVLIDGRAVPSSPTAPANRHLLSRAAAQAEIARLVQQRSAAIDATEKQRLKDQIVALSVEARVMSPFTSLLVLETEADYARFGIARRGLADILVVDERGLVAQKRSLRDVPPPDKAPPPEPKQVAGKLKKKASSRDSAGAKDDADGPALAAPKAAAAPSGGDAEADDSPMAAEEEAKIAESAPRAEPPPAPATAAPREDRAPAPSRRRPPSAPQSEARESRALGGAANSDGFEDAEPNKAEADPYEGPFREVMQLIARKDTKRALERASAWREEAPGDVMALVALGEALSAAGMFQDAARAYGSLVDLFPGRADLRRFAGERLEALAQQYGAAIELAVDTYRKARDQRPDHPASHHLLAFALVKQKQPALAFQVLEESLKQSYPDGRFAGVTRILREDLGLVAAVWKRAEPAKRSEIDRRLKAHGGSEENASSLRFVLNWETDANDVDFHIYDGKRGHAYYSNPGLRSGGELYADVTTGYGPECFTIRKSKNARAQPYTLQAHYYSRGPMGYGMGKLQIIDHDGKGNLTFDERPFVVMKDGAYLDLGVVR